MTREEAIRHLHTYSTTMGSGQTSDEEHKEAKRMAISALKEEPLSHEEAWAEIEDAHQIGNLLLFKEYLRGRRDGEKAQADIPVDGDLISRADAIEAIASKDETDGTAKVFSGRQVNEILSALPSADRPNDAIEHDKDWIIGCIKHDGFLHTDRFDKANQIILDALADRPVGEWIYKPTDESIADEWVCSKCGDWAFVKTDFCPTCGAKMKGGTE